MNFTEQYLSDGRNIFTINKFEEDLNTYNRTSIFDTSPFCFKTFLPDTEQKAY